MRGLAPPPPPSSSVVMPMPMPIPMPSAATTTQATTTMMMTAAPHPFMPSVTGNSTRPSAPPPPAEGWRESSTICPPGLHSLMHLDRVFIDREPDGIEVLRQWHSEKRYRVLNGTTGDQVYLALEESSECARCCLGKCHPWNMHIMDHNQHEVLRISRALRCDSCCFPCCMQEVTVRSNGELLGSVTQNWNIWRPSFTIRDADDVPVLLMKGPICLCCAGEVDFLIKSIDKQHSVGVITKKWSGLAREFFKDGNSFGVCFPVDLDVKIKAVLIGACFLIDFVYFEEQSNMRRLSKPRRISY